MGKNAFVVCRIFQKSGAGPQNGAQYGAPFLEEEWEVEADDAVVLMPDGGEDDEVNEAAEQEYLHFGDFVKVHQPVNLVTSWISADFTFFILTLDYTPYFS